jgi:hypothetical protein
MNKLLWQQYRTRSITEKHVSHNPSNDTYISQAGYVIEECIPANSKRILILGNDHFLLRETLRLLTAHAKLAQITLASNSADLEKTLLEISKIRRRKVNAVVCDFSQPPFKKAVFEHLIILNIYPPMFKRALDLPSLSFLAFFLKKPKAILSCTREMGYSVKGIVSNSWFLVIGKRGLSE